MGKTLDPKKDLGIKKDFVMSKMSKCLKPYTQSEFVIKKIC